MLKKRLIPVLLLKEGRMVKTINFEKIREVGYPVTTAKIYDAQTADELIFLDIMASSENRNVTLDIIREVAENCFMPLTVGGGVRKLQDIRKLLNSGADKVSINTAAIENPKFIRDAARVFGSQCIVVSIDSKEISNGNYEVYSCGGKKPTGRDVRDWAKEVESLDAGEIIITSIDREGTMKGYDFNLIKSVSEVTSIPIIANGGVGTLKDFVDCINLCDVSAVAASSIFHFTDQSPIKARRYIADAGINIRLG